ncbi:DUF1284 domain-containing protein [uncultured Clostridium sp.]|uniref:DUF1284 domain-containing protein n=1 Tax=uncultured Clostridium sp. TaxID=59620 RepID=UPI0025EDFE44|nr:DUF1284 domain-containing protein [uncultured Clostridium sp.]
MLKLRPHHINCIYFYRGLGYSNEFVKNMDKIVNELKSNDDIRIKFVKSCDDVCECCPNKLQSEKCNTADKVKEMDLRTIHRYNLNVDNIYNFSYIKNEIYKKMLANNFNYICAECEWKKQGVCKI